MIPAACRSPDEGGASRLDAVRNLMSDDAPFYSSLADKFKIRTFRFSGTADRVQSPAELTAGGTQTNLALALDNAVRDSAGLPLSGIVLFTDGANNVDSGPNADLATSLSNLRARGIPVFTVGLGQTRLDGDVEVVRATAPRRALKGSPITAELLVKASGAGGQTVKIDLMEDNHLLKSQTVPVTGDATSVGRITFTPSTPGLHRYTVVAEASPEEPVKENNSQHFLVQVDDSRPRILYIEGEPRWEYGKVRAALAEEKNVVLVSVLRSADGKFYRQGVESGEELASGFRRPKRNCSSMMRLFWAASKQPSSLSIN